MKEIVIGIGLILIAYISIVYGEPIDPSILDYRIDAECDNQDKIKPLQVKEKNLSLNLQLIESDEETLMIDFKEGLGDKITGRLYGNLDSKGHILEAQAKLTVEKKRFIFSTELAHLNQTPLMRDSLLGKVGFNFLPSSMFGFINHEGKINIGWLHLSSLYSRYTWDRDGTDLFGVGTKWRFYTPSYELTPSFLFKGELKLSPYIFAELPKEDYDEDIVESFCDFPVNYSLNFAKRLSQKWNIEMAYQGEINLSFYPWGVNRIPLNHGVVSKVNSKPIDTFLFQLIAYFPFENKKLSYFNPNASFMSKEILTNLKFKLRDKWDVKILSDYDYENSQFEEVTFSINRRFNRLSGGLYYTNDRNDSSTIGIYITTSKKGDYGKYHLTRYQEFPPQVFSVLQKEDLRGLKGRDFETTVRTLDTPEKVASYVDQFFQYHSEGRVIPQTPRETFEKKRGDCDDQARFISWVLTQHSYESYVLTYSGRRVGHGICVYKNPQGKWNAIEYGKIFYVEATNLEELITKIEPGMLKYTLFKPDEGYGIKSYLESQTLEKIINWFWAD